LKNDAGITDTITGLTLFQISTLLSWKITTIEQWSHW